jgi:hypothetical protein
MNFYAGMAIGIFIGVLIGIVIAALLQSAKTRDEIPYRWVDPVTRERMGR